MWGCVDAVQRAAEGDVITGQQACGDVSKGTIQRDRPGEGEAVVGAVVGSPGQRDGSAAGYQRLAGDEGVGAEGHRARAGNRQAGKCVGVIHRSADDAGESDGGSPGHHIQGVATVEGFRESHGPVGRTGGGDGGVGTQNHSASEGDRGAGADGAGASFCPAGGGEVAVQSNGLSTRQDEGDSLAVAAGLVSANSGAA